MASSTLGQSLGVAESWRRVSSGGESYSKHTSIGNVDDVSLVRFVPGAGRLVRLPVIHPSGFDMERCGHGRVAPIRAAGTPQGWGPDARTSSYADCVRTGSRRLGIKTASLLDTPPLS